LGLLDFFESSCISNGSICTSNKVGAELANSLQEADKINQLEMIGIPGVEKLRACLARLLPRGSSGGAGAILEEPQIVAPPKRLRLLCFLLKNGSSKKTFGRAPLEEPEPERSPAKQALYYHRFQTYLVGGGPGPEVRLGANYKFGRRERKRLQPNN